jgi:hypothetical protein
VDAEGQDHVLALAPGHRHREVIVDAFFELVEGGDAMRRRELDFGFADGVRPCRCQGMDRHGDLV